MPSLNSFFGVKIPLAFLFAATLTALLSAAPWARHVIDNSSTGADGVRLADIDGDGLLDITTGWEQGGVVRVYFNPGPRFAKQAWPAVSVGSAPSVEDAVFADLEGDGVLDVVSSAEGDTRTVFVHWAPKDKARLRDSAAWTTQPIPVTQGKAQWMFAAPAQLDGRHGIDLILGSKADKSGGAAVGWLEAPANPRDLSAWRWHELRRAAWVMGIEASDMDGDGDLDIVVSERFDGPQSGVFWLENPGKERAATVNWREHRIGLAGEDALFFAQADIDGDGLRDVVAGSHVAEGEPQSSLYFLRRLDASGQRWAERKIELPAGTAFKGVNAGDVDGDGKVDLVVSFVKAKGKPALLWLSHDGSPLDGRWTTHELSGVDGVKHDLVALLDLDGDGDLDAITTEEVTNLGVIWYENPTTP